MGAVLYSQRDFVGTLQSESVKGLSALWCSAAASSRDYRRPRGSPYTMQVYFLTSASHHKFFLPLEAVYWCIRHLYVFHLVLLVDSGFMTRWKLAWLCFPKTSPLFALEIRHQIIVCSKTSEEPLLCRTLPKKPSMLFTLWQSLHRVTDAYSLTSYVILTTKPYDLSITEFCNNRLCGGNLSFLLLYFAPGCLLRQESLLQ